MRRLNSVLGVIGAFVAILYCGWLLYYFLDLSGSVQEAETDGLGPTLLGLGAVGLLFCTVFIVRVVRIFGRPRSPGSGGRAAPDASTHDGDGDGDGDADAMLARYMARRSADAADSPAAPSARKGGAPAGRPSFGRRIR